MTEATPPQQLLQSVDDSDIEFLASGTLERRRDAAASSRGAAAAEGSKAERQFVYRRNADYDSLIEACSRKLAVQPGNTRVLMIRANSYAKTGGLGALHAHAAPLGLARSCAVLQCFLDASAMLEVHHPLSIAASRTGLGRQSQHRCKVVPAAGMLEAAFADYSAVLAAEPAAVDALYQRGSTAHKLGQLQAAIADFTAVLSLDPNHAKAAYSRAACNNLAGQFDDANGALRKLAGRCAIAFLRW